MSVIDQTGFVSAHAYDPDGNTLLRRESWMKALEEAGLRDALANTRRFVAAGVGFAATSEAADGGSDLHFALQRGAAEYGAMQQDQSASPDAQVAVNGGVRDSAVRRVVATAPEAFVGVGEAATPRRAGDTAKVSQDPILRLPMEMILRRQWEQRKITVLPYGKGVEIWVRDSSASDVDVTHLLDTLRKSANEGGAEVKRVFVNGRAVDAFASPNLSRSIPKEDSYGG